MTDTPRAEEHPYDEPDQLRDQVRQLLRHPVLIVGALALGVLGGVEAHRVTGGEYTATGQLLVDAPSTTPFNSSVAAGKNINMQTEQQVASSLVVANAAAQSLDEPGLQGSQLQKRLTVANSPNTEILQLSYTDSDPAEAARRVNAVMAAYLSQRQATATADLKSITQGLTSQLKPLLASYNSLSNQINGYADGDGTAKDYALSERASVATQIAAVQSQLATYQAVNTTPGQILAQAAPPTSPAGIDASLLAAIGGVVGLSLGILLAWLATVFDRRVRDNRDVLRHLGAPVLVTLPHTPGRLLPGRGLLTVGSSSSRLAEAYRTLALRVALATDEHDPRGILVVEPRTLGRAAAVAANLAAAYAETGEDVLLIEADLRRPRLRQRLDDRVGPEAVIRPEATAGSWPHRPVTVAAGSAGSFTLVPGSRVPAALRALALVDSEAKALRTGPTLVVTAPAVLSHPDALAVALWTDGVVVVGDPGGLRRTDLDQVREFLSATGTPVLGMVVTRTPGGWIGRLALRAADALRFGRREAQPDTGQQPPEAAGLERRTGLGPAGGSFPAGEGTRGLSGGRRETDGPGLRESDQEWLRTSLLERGSE
jgi:succinoglycan biosynthesis transport protein ExoP